MVVGTKRRRPVAKGLAPGERLKHDKLAGYEGEYSQWGWINNLSDPSLISMEHMLTAYGFLDKLRKPLCKNKYTKQKDTAGTDKKPAKEATQHPRVADGPQHEEDIIIISSGDEAKAACDKKRCRDNIHCLNYLGQVRLENEGVSHLFSAYRIL